MNKEEIKYIKTENGYKVSTPLITDDELEEIDFNFHSIVDEYLKEFSNRREKTIEQRLIYDLEQENKKLKSIIKTLIKEYNLEPTEYVENLLRGEIMDKEEIECCCYQEYEPKHNNPCEIKTKAVGKNLLDKEVIITGTPIKYVNDYVRVCNELEEQKKINKQHQKLNGELRTEIQELNDNSTWWKNRYEAVNKINKEKQDIIDKTIEVIHEMAGFGYQDGNIFYYSSSEFKARSKVLLEILKGEK